MATDLTKNNRRLDAIASQLQKIHGEFLALAGRSLGMAKTVGDLLVEAKSLVGHGDWEAWLEAHFPGSERSAQGYMRLASKWGEIECKSAETADLTLDAALKLLAKPKPEPKPERRVCPNCGGSDFDGDGDCTSCFEPPDDDPPESHQMAQDASDDESQSEDEEAGEDAGDVSVPHKEPFGEQLWLVVTRFWTNQYPEVPPVTVADYLEEMRDRVLRGER